MDRHVSCQVVVGVENFATLRTRECFLLGLARVLDTGGGWPRLLGVESLGEAEGGEGGEGGPHPPELGGVGEREHGGEPEAGARSAASPEEPGAGSAACWAVRAGDEGGEEAGAPGITARPSNYTPLVSASCI